MFGQIHGVAQVRLRLLDGLLRVHAPPTLRRDKWPWFAGVGHGADGVDPSVAPEASLFGQSDHTGPIMECEMCGKQVGTRRYLVDGTVMNLGAECSKYGTAMDKPAAQGSKAAVAQNLERRAQRMTSRDIYKEEVWDLVEDFGPRIRQARERKGWSHDQLGNRVSARVPQLRQIESGHLRPSDDLAKRMERELGITLMEKVEGGPAPAVTGTKPGGSGLTIGDLLKDAKKK